MLHLVCTFAGHVSVEGRPPDQLQATGMHVWCPALEAVIGSLWQLHSLASIPMWCAALEAVTLTGVHLLCPSLEAGIGS
jgi:hypothetical protein